MRNNFSGFQTGGPMKHRIENRSQVILESITDGVFTFTHVVMKKDQITKLR